TRAVRFDVIDIDHHVLRVRSAHLARAPHVGELLGPVRRADHDEPPSERELRVLDPAAFPLDLEANLEAEGAAEPVDRLRGVVIVEGGRDARPVGGRGFHGWSFRWVWLTSA